MYPSGSTITPDPRLRSVCGRPESKSKKSSNGHGIRCRGRARRRWVLRYDSVLIFTTVGSSFLATSAKMEDNCWGEATVKVCALRVGLSRAARTPSEISVPSKIPTASVTTTASRISHLRLCTQ